MADPVPRTPTAKQDCPYQISHPAKGREQMPRLALEETWALQAQAFPVARRPDGGTRCGAQTRWWLQAVA